MPSTNIAPDWALAIVRQGASKAAQVHGPEFLPQGPEMLGCGAFGCVFATSKKGWVCKVTIDGSEAFFARAQQRLALYPKGICRILKPLRGRTPAGPVWMLWKEIVEFPSFDQWCDQHRWSSAMEDKIDDLLFGDPSESNWQKSLDMRAKWKRKHGTDGFDILEEMQQRSMGVAMRFASYVEHIDERPASFAEALEFAIPTAQRMFRPKRSGIDWTYCKRDVHDDLMLAAAIDLLAFRWQLDRLSNHKLLSDLARAIGAFADEGIVLADAQPDNIARASGTWSIFDCGFAVPISRRWNDMWLNEEIRPELWASNDRWDFFQKLSQNA